MMFERFTDRARRSVVLAQDCARSLKSTEIDYWHIAAGLWHEKEGVAAQVIGAAGAGKAIEDHAAAYPSTEERLPPNLPFTIESKRVLEVSLREALQLGHNYIGTEHILLALIRHDPNSMSGLGVYRKDVITKLANYGEVPKPGKTGEIVINVRVDVSGAIADLERIIEQLRAASKAPK